MSKRTRRSTPQQFDAMLEYMTCHPQLINGKLSSSLKNGKRMKMWEELASTLNSGLLGPKKTVHQWRRAWIDLKSEVKEKLAESEVNKLTGEEAEILNPIHQRVANLLNETEKEVKLNEKHLKESRASKKIAKVKYEGESDDDDDDLTPAPLVISLSSNQNQTPYIESDSSNQYSAYEPEPSCSRSKKQLNFKSIISEAMETKARKRPYRRTEVEENEHLSNLVLVEKEKSDMLSAIAHALSTTNEHEEKRLKIEQDRNKLIQERNAIENERNELFKAFLEHMIEKSDAR